MPLVYTDVNDCCLLLPATEYIAGCSLRYRNSPYGVTDVVAEVVIALVLGDFGTRWVRPLGLILISELGTGEGNRFPVSPAMDGVLLPRLVGDLTLVNADG